MCELVFVFVCLFISVFSSTRDIYFFCSSLIQALTHVPILGLVGFIA